MNAFQFSSTQTIINQPGSISQLGEILQARELRNILIITDEGIIQLGLLVPALESLSNAGIEFSIFSEVVADPPEGIVEKALAVAKKGKIDAVIGIGGGSSMDVAKLVALLTNSTQSLGDIYGVGNAKGERLPLIQVPTTAGTGSEVTPIAIVTTGETTKQGIVAPQLLPDIALLDADLTLGLPPHITAATGIDAMVHAIEAYTSKHRKNPYSDMLAREALRLLAANIVPAVEDGQNRMARSNMLYGAMLAGQAFANAPVAAVHALAYPLGGHYHISHGLSNSLVLPHVLRFNLPYADKEYGELTRLLSPNSDHRSSFGLISIMENLIHQVSLPTTLMDMGIDEDDLPMLAEESMLQQRLLVNNPREVTLKDALGIYQSAYACVYTDEHA